MKPKALKTLKRIQMFTVSEDGTSAQHPQTIYIDSKAPVEFVIRMPAYISAALGGADEVRHATAAGVVPLFEARMRAYLDWYKTAKAEAVILLHAQLLSLDRSGDRAEGRHDIDHDAFFFRSSDVQDYEHKVAVGLTFRLAFRINGKIYGRKRIGDEFKAGSIMPYLDGAVVLDYTADLHDRLDRICGALHDAADVLEDIVTAPDVGKALMAPRSLRLTGPKS